MDSREKVLRLREVLQQHRPEDEESARALQTLSSIVVPLVARFLPSDPAELDRYLATVAKGAISCRSDGAAVLQVHLWDADAQEWRLLE